MIKVKKRNGDIVDFDSGKIRVALKKAFDATGEYSESAIKSIFLRIMSVISSYPPIVEIEVIQDIVEHELLKSTFSRTAKAYILYREQRSQIRKVKNKLNEDLLNGYLDKLDWRVNENSNMSYSLQGLNNYISSNVTSEYWLNKIYPVEVRDAHTNCDIHIHDLSLLAVYCVGWDLQDILLTGFRGVVGKVESGPPKHFKTALGQIINFFYTLQGESSGAQALSNFDTLLAPFIRHDKLSYDQVCQCFQEFLFNMNVPTRVGFQTPFTNITMDLYIPSILKDQPVIIGGKHQETTYSDYQEEMDILNKAFATVMLKGDAKGRIFSFPIPTYNITKDFDWNNPNLEPLWKMTGKYGIPYFSNFVNSDMSPDDARSMCCRLRLDKRELQKRGGGLFGANPLTGSIGVVTINLPHMAHGVKSRKHLYAFYNNLKSMLQIAKTSLEIKRKVIEDFTDKNLYPYTKFYLRSVKEQTGKYWANHFSTIGIIGMNEACMSMTGLDIGTKYGQKFALEVMDCIRDQLTEFQEETRNFYNLEATPAEGAGYRLAQKDGKEMYTNSTQLPVNYSDDVFEVLELQDELQTKYTGGTVLHMFIGEEISDIENVKNIIRKVSNNYRLPYFTISPTFSVCPKCGYLPGEIKQCTACGSDNEVYSRIVGYYRPVEQWNKGKKQEFKMRKTFKIKGV